jgi:hypothetical protein
MQTVYDKVSAIKSPSGKDLFQLNEAIFNIDRDEDPSTELSTKLFTFIQRVHRGYLAGKIGAGDNDYINDYIGLLGTMQNQAFFSSKQVQSLQRFMKETLLHVAGASEKAAPAASPLDNAEIKKLVDAVKTIQSFTAPADEAPKKGRSRGGQKKGGGAKEEAPAADAKPKRERKPRGEKKDKAEGEAEAAEKTDKPKRSRRRGKGRGKGEEKGEGEAAAAASSEQ